MASMRGGRDLEAFRRILRRVRRRLAACASGSATASSSTARSNIRPSSVQRDIDNLKAGVAKAQASTGAALPAGGRAGERAAGRQERTLQGRRELPVRARRRAARGIPGRSSMPASSFRSTTPSCPTCYERMVPPMTLARLPQLGGAAHRRAQPRARRHPGRALALSHLLGQLERPARLRRAAQGHHRPRAEVQVGGYSFEAANPRHEHEWRVWETVKLPDGQMLMPGVISHATNVVEHPELVAERIVRLAKIVGRENVIGGTDCGFAQSPFARRVHPSIMWAKLEALAEGARIATASCGANRRRLDAARDTWCCRGSSARASIAQAALCSLFLRHGHAMGDGNRPRLGGAHLGHIGAHHFAGDVMDILFARRRRTGGRRGRGRQQRRLFASCFSPSRWKLGTRTFFQCGKTNFVPCEPRRRRMTRHVEIVGVAGIAAVTYPGSDASSSSTAYAAVMRAGMGNSCSPASRCRSFPRARKPHRRRTRWWSRSC